MTTYATFKEDGTFLGFCKTHIHHRKPKEQIWVTLDGDVDPLLHTWEGSLADGKVVNLVKKSIYEERTVVFVYAELIALKEYLVGMCMEGEEIEEAFDHFLKRITSFDANPNVDVVHIGRDQEHIDEVFYMKHHINV